MGEGGRGEGQLGIGLMEVIIALGLLTIIVAATSQFMGRSMLSQSSLELRGDKEGIRRRLIDQISCSTTLAPNANAICPGPGAVVTLKGTNASGPYTVLSGNIRGTLIGRWTYRAECAAKGGPVNVRALHLNKGFEFSNLSSNAYAKDPMTQQTITINDPRSLLFPAGAELCGSGSAPIQKIVTGHYSVAGPIKRIELGGKPIRVTVYSPSIQGIPPAPQFCIKIGSMPGNTLMCSNLPNVGAMSTMSCDSTGFYVGGLLSRSVGCFATYCDWVYEAVIEN